MQAHDDKCEAFVGECLHTPYNPILQPEDTSFMQLRTTCFAAHGVCQRLPCRAVAEKLVKSFHYSIEENSLEPGDLLQVSVKSKEAQVATVLLGVCLSRPRAHTFLRLCDIPQPGGELQFLDDCDQLNMCTSMQLFQQMLEQQGEQSRETVQKLSVEVWDTSFSWNPVLCRVVMSLGQKRTAFVVDSRGKAKKRVSDANIRLPFGVSIAKPKRKTGRVQRKRQALKDGDAGAGAKGKRGRQALTEDIESILQQEEGDVCLAEPEVESDAASSSQFSEVSEALALPTGEHDSDPNENLHQASEEEAECVLPPTAQAASEDRSAKKEASNWQEETQKATAAAQAGKTYFSAQTGVDAVDLAATARSRCYLCSTKIPKSAPRFSWFHSLQRPSNWVHAECLVPLAKREGKVPQIIGRLNVLQDAHGAGSVSGRGRGQKRKGPPSPELLAIQAALSQAKAA